MTLPSPFFIVLKRLRYPLILLVCVYAALILGFTLIPGQDDEGNVWYMSFFHAFYFVSFMGSTIGFGEIPYPFTDAQRFWAILGIFASVIAWLYSIGNLLTILKDPAFQRVLSDTVFQRQVKHLSEPFYLICGYGDTGKLLAHELSKLGIQSVVIDKLESRIEALDIDEQDMDIPALCANALFPENLMMAGIRSTLCQGVLALTDNDQVNLKIAITCKLMNKKLMVIARANTRETMTNMKSFDTDHVLNPFDIFARHLALSVRSPGAYLLYNWFTSATHHLLDEPPVAPRGHWLICGYGRFGKAVSRYLQYEGITTTIIEAQPELTHAPENNIRGSGAEAITLKQAGVQQADAIVAGTDNDSNNLSIIVTAKDIVKNQPLYTVVRQNFHRNSLIYESAQPDLIMQPARIIADEILSIIKTPLLFEFLKQVGKQKKDWVNLLISRISAVFDNDIPNVWSLNLLDIHDMTISSFILKQGIRIADIMKNPRNREQTLCCIPLMIKNRNKQKNKPLLLPPLDYQLSLEDNILFCGNQDAQDLMHYSVHNINSLQYVVLGEAYARGYIWQWISNMKTRTKVINTRSDKVLK